MQICQCRYDDAAFQAKKILQQSSSQQIVLASAVALNNKLAETSVQWIYAAANACRSTSSWPVQPTFCLVTTELPCETIA